MYVVCGIFWMFRHGAGQFVSALPVIIRAQRRLNSALDVLPIDLYSGGMQAR
jgi:hypothetical protein